MKNIGFILIALLTLTTLAATNQSSKTKTSTFITSAVCEECKERIEEKLNYTKGIVFAELNLENKMLTVKFKTEVITEQQIKEVLANIGYSSDTVVRNRQAFEALPKCCQGSEVCPSGK